MLKSMTGFGRGEYKDEHFSFVSEIKSVNHRYSEVAIRLPKFLNPLEDKIRKKVLARLSRGRIDVFITASWQGDNYKVEVDAGLATAYHEALKNLMSIVSSGEQLSATDEVLFLAKNQDILKVTETPVDVDSLWEKIEGALESALEQLVSMREAEALNICADVRQRVDLIEQYVAVIAERAPEVVTEYEARLAEKTTELLRGYTDGTVEAERLMQEVALFADRVNITEEIVRLTSHIKQFRSMLSAQEPVGRKMDFLIQEFNREANTIGSKANDSILTENVVAVKAEIEKIREQIQNIE